MTAINRQRGQPEIVVPLQCPEMIHAGALVAVSHSGGKDSRAMTILLSQFVRRDQLLFVHAPLGKVEWPGTVEHIERTIPPGAPLILAHTATGKSLLERIEERGRFPDAGRRYCTSDLQRGPIERELRRCLKAHPRIGGRIASAMGMRAAELRPGLYHHYVRLGLDRVVHGIFIPAHFDHLEAIRHVHGRAAIAFLRRVQLDGQRPVGVRRNG